MSIHSRNVTLLIALGAAALASCVQPPEQIRAKFEAVYRSSKAIEGGIRIGISYLRFSESLHTFSTELLVAEERGNSPREKELVRSYRRLLDIYLDSLKVWRHKVEASPNYYGARNAEGAEVLSIAKKYSPNTKEDDPFPGNVIQLIWAKAAEEAAVTTKLYYAQP